MSYEIETTITVGDEEIPVTVDYTVTYWGSSGSGPSLSHPGDPPEAPEFEINSIFDDNKEYEWDKLSKTDQDRIDEGIYESLYYTEPDYPEPDYD